MTMAMVFLENGNGYYLLNKWEIEGGGGGMAATGYEWDEWGL